VLASRNPDRTAIRATGHPPLLLRPSRALPSVLSSERRACTARSIHIGWPARTGRSAAWRMPPTPPRPLDIREIGFAPETIALGARSAALFMPEMRAMTAYMISFALAGLVVLAVCDPWFGRREACQGCYPCVRGSADKPTLDRGLGETATGDPERRKCSDRTDPPCRAGDRAA
jgi:hypothetical protein